MKAVLPAAGTDGRMLPAAKSMPKEMLPVLDKLVMQSCVLQSSRRQLRRATTDIQYVVEEAAASGCDEIILVPGRGKRAIEDDFDHSFELEHHLQEKGKLDLPQQMEEIRC